MFTGRWVQQGGAAKGLDGISSVLNENHIGDLRKVGRGFDLPSATKFRSGHLAPGAIPVSQAIPVSGRDNRSGSDMDTSSGSEDDVYERYSLYSSPRDDKIPNRMSSRYTNPVQRTVDHGINKNQSWSREPVPQKQRNPEDKGLDSATSVKVSFMHYSRTNERAPQQGAYTSDSYSSGVNSSDKIKMTAKQDFSDRRPPDEDFLHKEMPSAPPVSSDAGMAESFTEISSSANSTNHPRDAVRNGNPDPSERIASGKDVNVSMSAAPPCFPTFHASGRGPWCAVISYDACVRLCLHSWANGCTKEAPYFLDNECAILRDAFGLRQVLLRPEEELLNKESAELVGEGAASKANKALGKMKVQVRKVRMGLDPSSGCNFSSLNPAVKKLEPLRRQLSALNSTLHSGWEVVRKVRVTPQIPPNGTLSQQSLAYMRAGTQYIKQVSRLLKSEVTTLRNSPSSYEAVQEAYTCLLRMKSTSEDDSVRMQPGSGETHMFFPDNPSDDLIIEVQDSKGRYYGRAVAQVAAIADDPSDKLRWWPIYHEPEHELIGRIQLHVNYSTTPDDSNNAKCGCVAETVAYDFVLEVTMKVQEFQRRKLLLHGSWKWLVNEFASYYGVADAYTKLRYLSYVMDVATPTKDCLDLIHELLEPVLMKGNRKSVLSHQENRILGEIEDQIQQILALVFENYKALDELSPSGLVDVVGPATGVAAPALRPAVKLYSLLHDIFSSEVQLKFCRYFQAAARKRSRRHMTETEDLLTNEGALMDPVIFSSSYQKMKSLILSIKNEIFTDLEIHEQDVLPSFIDLPNLCASLYSVDLSSRLRSFLVSCPPSGPSPPVVDLVITTADFQKDLASWNINNVKGGVDAKELFHLYITLWIQDKRLALLELCKIDKMPSLFLHHHVKFMTVKMVQSSGVRTQNSTTTSPFVDEMYERLKETLNNYEVIISRWPEYIVALENAIADVEKAIVEALEKQHADVLSPLKDSLAPRIFGLKYVQKFAKRTGEIYVLPDELGILLNSLKRMLDVLRPKIGARLKSWASCMPETNTVAGETLSEITVMLRTKYRSYLQAIVEKLVENTKMQNATKLKSIIQDSKETVVESDVRSRMQPLTDLLLKTIDNLQSVVEPTVFVSICRAFWDRMGQDILRYLQNGRENRSWYKGSRLAVSVLDDIFASEMQRLLGNALQAKDLEPPRSIMEARSVLCKDAVNHQDSNYYY